MPSSELGRTSTVKISSAALELGRAEGAEAVAPLKFCEPLIEALPLGWRADKAGHHHIRRGPVRVRLREDHGRAVADLRSSGARSPDRSRSATDRRRNKQRLAFGWRSPEPRRGRRARPASTASRSFHSVILAGWMATPG